MFAEVSSGRLRETARLVRDRDLSAIRAGVWAVRAHRRVKILLRDHGIEAVAVADPPAVGDRARSASKAVLSLRRATCLESALVLQRFDAAAGHNRDLIIGVTSPATGFRAHAWLDGDPQRDASLHEIRRFGPPVR